MATTKVSRELLHAALNHTLLGTDFDGLGKRYEGKVRDNYSVSGGRRLIVVTDRISAFDRVIGTLPFKGQVLNRVATWWFDRSRHVAANHMIRQVDPCVIEVVECEPLPVEMVVRAYLTGVTSTSNWTHYQRGEREFCGHALPDGLRENQALPRPILTPSTKADRGGHDISASREQILQMGKIREQDFDAAADMAMALFAFGQRVCKERGLILVDTKYEFGRTPDGRIVVIDEIHTPDSSRFWFEGTYGERFSGGQRPDSFDKEYVRRWLSGQGFTGEGPVPAIPDDVRVEAASRYIETYETIVGEPFVPDTAPPLPRIRRNLGLAG